MWKSRITFAVGVAVSLVLIAIYKVQAVGFGLLYIFCALFICALASILVAPLVLCIVEQSDKEGLEKNEASFYQSFITNSSLLPYYSISQTYRQTEHQWKATGFERNRILPRQGFAERRSLRFPYRGNYEVGLKSIVITDFLGLFHRTIAAKNPIHILVYPRPDLRFLKEIVAHLEEGPARTIYAEDYTTIEDLRPYHQGDSLKRVHWKLSAKWNELMIKNFEPIADSTVVLFLDTKAVPLPWEERLFFEDKIISFVASAMHVYALESTPTEFIYGVVPLERVEISSLAQQHILDRVLAEVEFKHPETLVPHYYRAIAQDSRPLFIYFFLFDLTPDVLSGLGRFLASGHSIYLYYFHSPSLPLPQEHSERLAGLREQGVLVFEVEVTPDEPK